MKPTMNKRKLPTDEMLNNSDFHRIVSGYGPLLHPEYELYSYPNAEKDYPDNPCFTDWEITIQFPIPKGTKYTNRKITWKEESWYWPALLDINWLPYLADMTFIDYYNERCQHLIDNPPTKDMFKEHSLYFLKESLKVFSPYSKPAKKLLRYLVQMDYQIKDPFYLKRFLNAQDYGGQRDDMSNYQTALAEIKAGNKKTHWIWYVFPQMAGLGHSEHATFYGIKGRDEAYAYMEHPILSSRLIEATQAVLDNKHTAYEIFGQDTIKFRSCMLLFSTISDHPVFKKVIQKHHW